ncbi:unnamed protein product [Mytilus coruscus]|uniref:Transposase Tc1-like domain-containing protein n=1 Tax=Mytilus coruscus TaxID=42192 RepID=A0A6J8DF82_MYTCO|nr:unnamed protein product [Mytilus coruscus]
MIPACVITLEPVDNHDELNRANNVYRQSWPVHAIVRRLAEIGIDVTWGTVKNVIKRYQYGKIGYENFNHKDQNLPTFQYITDQDINFVKTGLTENPTRTSTNIKHILADKGTHTSKSTVRKVIDAAGYTASKPRYGQMVRDVCQRGHLQTAIISTMSFLLTSAPCS